MANRQDVYGVRADGKQNSMGRIGAKAEIQHAYLMDVFGILTSQWAAFVGFAQRLNRSENSVPPSKSLLG